MTQQREVPVGLPRPPMPRFAELEEAASYLDRLMKINREWFPLKPTPAEPDRND